MVDPSQLQHGPCHPGDSSDNATQPSGANSIPDNVWATPGYNFYSISILRIRIFKFKRSNAEHLKHTMQWVSYIEIFNIQYST